MKTLYTSSMPDWDLIYRAYASTSQTKNILVYAWYMQRPFRFNLAISTAKNLACVGHTLWYKNQQIPTLTPNRGCTSGIHHHKRPNVNTDGNFLQMGHWLVYGRYMAYTTDTPAKNTNDHQ